MQDTEKNTFVNVLSFLNMLKKCQSLLVLIFKAYTDKQAKKSAFDSSSHTQMYDRIQYGYLVQWFPTMILEAPQHCLFSMYPKRFYRIYFF